MKRTKMLFRIMLILIWSILMILVIKNFDLFKEKYTTIKNIFTPKKVDIPSSSYNNRKYLFGDNEEQTIYFKTVKLADSFEPQNIEDIKNIYYTVLNNGWTDFTFYCPDEYKSCYDDVLAVADDDDYISLINNYVSTYNQYRKYNTSASTNGEIKLKIEKLYTEDEILALKLKISNLLPKFNIRKENIKYQDLRNIQDHIISILTYDDNYKEDDIYSTSSTAYGAFNTGKAICSGYTDIYALFLDELKIPNFKITSENHIWNVVYFGNKWRHVDVTWDDDEVNPNNIHNFFMLNNYELFEKDIEEHNYNKDLYLELLNQDN